MRIIAGELKGRSVELPKGSRARPATGYVRELVMNLLETGAPDGSSLLHRGPFLDLFAASGVTGFEALSRGAPLAVFVEIDARHAAQIMRTAYEFEVQDRCKVLKVDARRCFNAYARLFPGQPLAAAFADPPFIESFARRFVPYLGKGAALFLPEAKLIVRSQDTLPEAVAGLRLIESHSGGKARLYTYAPVAEQA